MGLKIKPAPRQLEPTDLIEAVWPGDSSVDLERSDLVTWCIEGGKTGLAFKDDGAQIWKLRPLHGRALARVLVLTGDPMQETEAFRIGVVAAPGLRLSWDTLPGGVRALTDSALDMIEDGVEEMDLPLLAAIDAAKGIERDKVRQDLVRSNIFTVLGSHVLAASFR